MNILINKTLISESALHNENSIEYGKIFEKMSRYARMSVATLNESQYHKRYNPDILFNLEEQKCVTDILCVMRMHLYESMKSELNEYLISEGLGDLFKDKLKRVSDKVKDVAKNTTDNVKKATADAKNYIDRKVDEIAVKFKNALIFLNELIKKGITSVKELVSAFGKLIIKLGDNFATALEKLGAFKADEDTDNSEDLNISKELDAANIPNNQKAFFSHVVEFVALAMSNKDTKAKLTESFSDVMNSVGNNKVFQFIFSVSKNRKKWSWIHTILVSLVGTFIISVILPMFMTCLGAASSVIVATTTTLACVWSTRSLLRVVFNRWLSKDSDEKFWNWQTVLGVILSTVPVGLLQVPVIREWFIDGLKSFCEYLGVDKLINNIEELLGKLVEKCGGTNWTQETVEVPGKFVKETIESYVGQGEAHTELMNAASGHNYINDLFSQGSVLTKFPGSDDLRTWLYNVCDAKYTGSMDMLHSLSGSLSSDAPITAVLDGNTFGHVSRSVLTKAIEHVASETGVQCDLINVTNDALRDGTSGWAGTAFALVFDANATTENSVLVNDMIKKVAEEVGAKATPGYSTFGTIANKLSDSVTSWHESVINTITTHKLFNTLMDCFNPVFNPFFKKEKWGDYMIRLGSNASGYTPFAVTDVKHMKFEEVAELDSQNPALNILVKHIQDVQKQHKDDIQSGINQSKDEDGKIPEKNKKTIKKHISIFSKNNNIGERDLMVIFVSGKYKVKKDDKFVEKELKNSPAVVMDLQTMYCCDIAPWFAKRRKNIYPIMGLFARLDFIPVQKNDNDTKEFIYQMLEKFTDTAIKVMVENGTASCYITKSDNKFVPADKDKANESYFDMGGFSADQICSVLNGDTDAYSYLDGKYAKNVSVSLNKEGNIKSKKQRADMRIIENKRFKKTEDGKFVEDKNGQYDYVDARIIPFANKYCIDEIKKDEDLAYLFLNDEQTAINNDIIDNKELNLKQWLFRPAKSFSKEDKHELGKSIIKYLDTKDKEELKDAYVCCKKFIEIIWRAIYEKLEKSVAKRNTSEKINKTEENKSM